MFDLIRIRLMMKAGLLSFSKLFRRLKTIQSEYLNAQTSTLPMGKMRLSLPVQYELKTKKLIRQFLTDNC